MKTELVKAIDACREDLRRVEEARKKFYVIVKRSQDSFRDLRDELEAQGDRYLDEESPDHDEEAAELLQDLEEIGVPNADELVSLAHRQTWHSADAMGGIVRRLEELSEALDEWEDD